MTKQAWFEHVDSIGILRVSLGGAKAEYLARIKEHVASGCRECADRLKTVRANRAAKGRAEAYRSCGLVRVKGALGGTYWE